MFDFSMKLKIFTKRSIIEFDGLQVGGESELLVPAVK